MRALTLLAAHQRAPALLHFLRRCFLYLAAACARGPDRRRINKSGEAAGDAMRGDQREWRNEAALSKQIYYLLKTAQRRR